jgi:23S rRNA (pseudouridine1915-N3)-methyltransferase
MKIVLIYVNNKKSVHDDVIDEYKKRLSRYADFDELRIDHSDIKIESENILNKIDIKDYLILLDETGSQVSSLDFAEILENKQNDSVKKLIFVIGGAYGVSEDIKERANHTLSLSKMVWPHELARLMIIEQIYRGYSILNSLPYHHK